MQAPWQDLLHWWFGQGTSATEIAAEKQRLWFGYRPQQDAEARERAAEAEARATQVVSDAIEALRAMDDLYGNRVRTYGPWNMPRSVSSKNAFSALDVSGFASENAVAKYSDTPRGRAPTRGR